MNEEKKNYTIELFLDNGHGCGGSIQKYVCRKTFEEMLRDAYDLLQQYKGLGYDAFVSTDGGKIVISNMTALILYMINYAII